MTYQLFNGDCIEVMGSLPRHSVSAIITDLPYGTTSCQWDSVISLASMWRCYKRLIKPNGAIVLFAQQPFTSILIMSNVEQFKYVWHWRKSRPSGFTNAKLKPLKDIEDICVFSEGSTANGSKNNMPYYPQGLVKVDKVWNRPKAYVEKATKVSPSRENGKLVRLLEFANYPRQVLDFANPNEGLVHETQKPLDLMSYLVKTYSQEGGLVLDSCMGSGSTGIAALSLNRQFIGIEKDITYFELAKHRIEASCNCEVAA